MFYKLALSTRNLLKDSDSHGLMANRIQLLFYGVVHLPIQFQDVKIEEVFVVSHISENAILENSFMMAH